MTPSKQVSKVKSRNTTTLSCDSSHERASSARANARGRKLSASGASPAHAKGKMSITPTGANLRKGKQFSSFSAKNPLDNLEENNKVTIQDQ